MAWETRRGRRYYYRARKEDGRVVKEYVGTGPSAEIAALQDRSAREERATAAQARKAEQDRLEAIDSEVTHIDHAIEAVTQVNLLLAGYHRHHRDAWRRRRNG